MQATIDIDLGPLANEWEPVAFRKAKDGEFYFYGGSVFTDAAARPRVEVLIVRRKWTFPSWLKARWYCEDADGSQCVTDCKPRQCESMWGGVSITRIDLLADIPKIGGDWRQSLRENPNYKGGK